MAQTILVHTASQWLRSKDWINEQGYDLIVIPRGASLCHDGQKFRVFTKPEYRNAGGLLASGG